MPFSERLEEAFAWAHELHRDQTRKASARPYVTHLLSVAGIVAEYGGSEETIIAAFLHDAVEDQGGDAVLAEIGNRFGETVGRYVDACTDAYVLPKPPWRERKEAFVEKTRRAPEGARLIIAADKVHNLRSMIADYEEVGDGLWDRFKASREDIEWYHGAVLAALGEGWTHPILGVLAAVQGELMDLGRDRGA